ncbi:MAG: hypothetical protein ACYSSL_03675 [Planctomycetota bacterium]
MVKLGQATPQDVAVELYHGRIDSWGNIENGSAVRMEYKEKSENEGEHWFTGAMSCKNSGRQGLAVRVLPNNKDLVNPYELGLILWERGT